MGTVDSDYRGEVIVTIYLFGSEVAHEIRHGDRIAQMVVNKLVNLVVAQVEELAPSELGSGDHGSTGR